jgi:hypothetical protein
MGRSLGTEDVLRAIRGRTADGPELATFSDLESCHNAVPVRCRSRAPRAMVAQVAHNVRQRGRVSRRYRHLLHLNRSLLSGCVWARALPVQRRWTVTATSTVREHNGEGGCNCYYCHSNASHRLLGRWTPRESSHSLAPVELSMQPRRLMEVWSGRRTRGGTVGVCDQSQSRWRAEPPARWSQGAERRPCRTRLARGR